MQISIQKVHCHYDVEDIMTPTSWSYTQKLDLSELRYMVQILRSDNDVMQARSIRRMIELICRGTRQGFCDEIIEVIKEEQLMKMLRIRTHFSRKEVQMIRDVLMHIIEALQPYEQEIEDNQQQQASQVTDLNASSSSCNIESEQNQIINEEETQAQLETEVALLRKAIAEGERHLYNKELRDDIAFHIKQRENMSSRLSRRIRRNKSNSSTGSGVSVNSTNSEKDNQLLNSVNSNE
ncbi:MAG: hypothetical protein EZS28_024415 [Streblomastix strix]|uniref:Uncharacterized protein n=1 Tax=Streblomastix strix TaxID=222440 RepID=A0A5J4VC05_9EUKA|nr:MAG: hypothetical protein EZS28_024415 [Streblomastix strix]